MVNCLASSAFALGALLLAIQGAAAQKAPSAEAADSRLSLPPAVVEGAYVTLEDIRANSAKVFEAFAGPDGGPIPRKSFISSTLPPSLGPEGQDPQLLRKLFEVLDANGNDRLTREEWNRQIEKDISFADQNGDGRITLKELANARENMGIGDALEMIF